MNITQGPYAQSDVLAQTSTICPGCGADLPAQVDYLGTFQPDPMKDGLHGYNVAMLCTRCQIRRVKRVLLP